MKDEIRGARITSRMKELKITAEKLATMCNVSPKTIYKWKGGETLPDHRVMQIAKHLDWTTDTLLMGHNNPNANEFVTLINSIPRKDATALLNLIKTIYSDHQSASTTLPPSNM
jgi:transcriptional regulator with XRE-family HTH domain